MVQEPSEYVPANGLTLGAASAVVDPTSRTVTAENAAGFAW